MQIAYCVDDFTDPWTKPDTLLLLHAAMGNAQRWFQWVPRLVRRGHLRPDPGLPLRDDREEEPDDVHPFVEKLARQLA